ncbi:MAG: hypothetical protein IPK71_10275 [Myxococcales bacterium]|nr:hypothetical protein [Myxococcales bacterium]
MDPFRGLHGLEERERLLLEEKRTLELELENLRRLAPPREPTGSWVTRHPPIAVVLCGLALQAALLLVAHLRRPPSPHTLGPKVAPASQVGPGL